MQRYNAPMPSADTPQFRTLVETPELAERLNDRNWLIFDCRFSLGEPDRGRRDFEKAHIPGAQYLHLDRDLSGNVIIGTTGRHPLPDPLELANTLAAAGMRNRMQVVVYDDSGGSMAARLWWLLKWLGHEAVAVLNGGWNSWTSEGREVSSELATPQTADFRSSLRPELTASMEEVRLNLHAGRFLLLDARSPERFRGELEPIDPIAGHIPGAKCAPYEENLDGNGCFRRPEEIRQKMLEKLGGTAPQDVITYCGSGVTAAHNVLAFEVADLPTPRLYPGSWSEWITRQENPIALGAE